MKKIMCVMLISNAFTYGFMPSNNAERRSSYPFITGDTFRSYCNHVLDEASTFNPSVVRNGEIVFVSPNFIDRFFNHYESKITARFVMVTHNADERMPGRYRYYLDDPKLIAWFGVNTDFPLHKKLYSIPIGFANRYWSFKGPRHGNPDVYQQAVQDNFFWANKRDDKLVYVNFAKGTNPGARNAAYDHLSTQNFTYLASVKPHLDYLKEMATFRFVASPLGNGIDCHRTWEALAVGCIPIVQASSINEIYEGLPVVIIDDWSQVTHEFLEATYEQMKGRMHEYHEERKYMDYWLAKIDSVYLLGSNFEQ